MKNVSRMAEGADLELLKKMRRIEFESKDPAMKARARRYINAMQWWISTGQSRGTTPPGSGTAADRILKLYESEFRG